MDVSSFRKTLEASTPTNVFQDESLARIAVQEAISALEEGNFGVGAVIAGRDGNIIARGHNRVFAPVFRSDLHAEMDVLNQFESAEGIESRESTLVTSLECCPMCMVRIITSRIGRVLYLADDPPGGMIHRRSGLPNAWKALAERQSWERARCSPELIELASSIFFSTSDDLYAQLQRCQ